MLIRAVEPRPNEGYIMSDAVVLAASFKTSLLEIARQASALGNGLQNAAPGGPATPNSSVSYLLGAAENITRIAAECGKLDTINPE